MDGNIKYVGCMTSIVRHQITSDRNKKIASTVAYVPEIVSLLPQQLDLDWRECCEFKGKTFQSFNINHPKFHLLLSSL